MKQNGAINYGISMGESYWKRLDAWAEQAGMSRSWVVRMLIEELAQYDLVEDGGLFPVFRKKAKL